MNDTDPGGTDPSGEETEAANERCDCCDGDADFESHVRNARLETEPSLIGSSGGETVLDVELPDGLQDAAGRFLGGVTVETLGDWVTEVRERTGGGAIEVEDLCREGGKTGHWGDLDGERYHFTCFFDAVVLAALVDRPVAIGTESPDGTAIEATATGDVDLTVDPPGTLVSFGIATDPGSLPDGDPTHEDVYASVCPVVRAFPTPRAYERWAETVPAATVAMPLEDAAELAEALVE